MSMLAGIRVLDLSRLLPGPFATWLLQAHGAEVVKLEEPRGGDYLRWIPPFEGEHGAMFTALNRDKRSVTLDLRQPEGQQALLSLLPRFDVVLESFRPGVLARFGLDFERLHQLHPRLVLASLTGFGQDGAWAGQPGHDLNFEGLAGLLAPAARSGGVPALPGLPVADLAGGSLMAAFTITAALLQRERTGRGARLDLSMTDGAATLIYPFVATTRAMPEPPPPGGDMLTGGHACYGVYRCADERLITVAALEPQFLKLLLQETGLGPAPPDRAALSAVFATQPRDHWVERLAPACVAPLLELDELLEGSLVASRGVLGLDEHGLWAAPPEGLPVRGPAPALGAHSRAELEAAGLDFEALRRAGISSEPAGPRQAG
jgi:alpha-methylacyl-CoA racemase